METVPPLPPLSVSQRALDLGSVPRSPPKTKNRSSLLLLRRVSTRVRSSFLGGSKVPTSPPPPCPPTIAEHLTLSPEPMEPPPLRCRQPHALPMPPRRLGSSSSGTPESSLLSPRSTRFAAEDNDGSTLTLPIPRTPTDVEPMPRYHPTNTALLDLSQARNNKGYAALQQPESQPRLTLDTQVPSTLHHIAKTTPSTASPIMMDPLYALPLLLAKRDLTAQDSPRSPTEQSDLPLSPSEPRNDPCWGQACSPRSSLACDDDHGEPDPTMWEARSRPWSSHSTDLHRRVHRASRGWSASSNFSAFDGQPVGSDTEEQHPFPWSSSENKDVVASGELERCGNHLGLNLGEPNTSFATVQEQQDSSGLVPTDLWCSVGVEAEDQAAMVAERHAALSKLMGEPSSHSAAQAYHNQSWDDPVQSRCSRSATIKQDRPKLAHLRLPPPSAPFMSAASATPSGTSPYSPCHSACPANWKTSGTPLLGSPLSLDSSRYPEVSTSSPSYSNSPYNFHITELPRLDWLGTPTLLPKMIPPPPPPTPTLRRKAAWSPAHPLPSSTNAEAHGYNLAHETRIHRWLDQVSLETST